MAKVLVTGGTGLVGNAIRKYIETKYSEHECIAIGSEGCDLTYENDVCRVFGNIEPDYVTL